MRLGYTGFRRTSGSGWGEAERSTSRLSATEPGHESRLISSGTAQSAMSTRCREQKPHSSLMMRWWWKRGWKGAQRSLSGRQCLSSGPRWAAVIVRQPDDRRHPVASPSGHSNPLLGMVGGEAFSFLHVRMISFSQLRKMRCCAQLVRPVSIWCRRDSCEALRRGRQVMSKQ